MSKHIHIFEKFSDRGWREPRFQVREDGPESVSVWEARQSSWLEPRLKFSCRAERPTVGKKGHVPDSTMGAAGLGSSQDHERGK